MYIIHDFKVSETHQRLVVELDDIQDSPESEQTERGEICQTLVQVWTNTQTQPRGPEKRDIHNTKLTLSPIVFIY